MKTALTVIGILILVISFMVYRFFRNTKSIKIMENLMEETHEEL